ncbi:hypothetical protein MHAS44199_09150 [Mycolicibacterium hassiacum DSM 44199]|nr:hypothetical protein [Mycolicibacterium hassiacum DSM 44199]
MDEIPEGVGIPRSWLVYINLERLVFIASEFDPAENNMFTSRRDSLKQIQYVVRRIPYTVFSFNVDEFHSTGCHQPLTQNNDFALIFSPLLFGNGKIQRKVFDLRSQFANIIFKLLSNFSSLIELIMPQRRFKCSALE